MGGELRTEGREDRIRAVSEGQNRPKRTKTGLLHPSVRGRIRAFRTIAIPATYAFWWRQGGPELSPGFVVPNPSKRPDLGLLRRNATRCRNFDPRAFSSPVNNHETVRYGLPDRGFPTGQDCAQPGYVPKDNARPFKRAM